MNRQTARYTGSFTGISKIILPLSCLNKAYKQLRQAAMQRREGLALFAGVEEHDRFCVLETLLPQPVDPQPVELSSGEKAAMVPADELQRIQRWLQENHFNLIAQIHSIPRHHFPVTRSLALPLLQAIGALSIVVPDFAMGPSSPESWNVFRLSNENKWIALDKNEVCCLFEITY